jgi:hypothetical protein
MYMFLKNFFVKIHEKARGLNEDSLIIVVEATEGCNINQGKCAKRVKSTKFVKQILSTCITLLTISKFAENSQKYRWSRYSKKTLTSLTCLKIFMQNGKVGKGDIFSQENIFIALIAQKFQYSIITIKFGNTISRMKVRQHVLGHGYYFLQYH